MVVQCPHCSSKYRVNATNIPSTGGRIKCPSCKESFVVYPEAEQQESMEDKTSIAAAPNLQQMMAGLHGGGGQRAAAPDEDAGATEVMSGDALPDFAAMFGGGGGEPGPDDGTVEMQNPMSFYGGGGASSGGVFDEDEGEATQVVSADALAAGAALFGSPAPQPAPQPVAPTPQPVAPTPQPVAPAPQPANPFAGMSQPAAPEPQPLVSAASAGPDPNHGGPWKLKTSYGLTYEYPDNRNLLNWINKQEDLTGYELSADGGQTFYPLESFPQIKGSGGGGGASSAGLPPPSGNYPGPVGPASGAPTGGGFTPGGGASIPGPAITNTNAPKLESRDAKWKGAVYGVLALVFVLGAVVALDFTGTFKVGIFPEEKPKTAPTPPSNNTTATPTPATASGQEGPTAEHKALAKNLIRDARHALKNNRFPFAKEKLNSAIGLDPNNAEAYELLAQVHEQLGEKDKAAEMKKLAAEKGKGGN